MLTTLSPTTLIKPLETNLNYDKLNYIARRRSTLPAQRRYAQLRLSQLTEYLTMTSLTDEAHNEKECHIE